MGVCEKVVPCNDRRNLRAYLEVAVVWPNYRKVVQWRPGVAATLAALQVLPGP